MVSTVTLLTCGLHLWHLFHTQWVPHITHHCPNTPFLLVGLEIELRDDAEALERLARVNDQPVSADTAEEAARELGAVKYVECSFVTQEGLKNALDEATLAALASSTPAGPARGRRWIERLMPCLFGSELPYLKPHDQYSLTLVIYL